MVWFCSLERCKSGLDPSRDVKSLERRNETLTWLSKNKFGLVNRYPCVRFYGSLFAACLPGRLCHFGWLNFHQVKAIHSNSRSTEYSWPSLFIRMLETPETIRCRNKVLVLFIGCIKFMMAALDRWNTNCALQQCEGLLTTSHISLNAFSLRSPLFQDI